MPPSVSVVIPMYNEQDYVGRAVSAAREVLERIGSDYEIIVVDDASTDATASLADELAHADARIRVVRHAANRGLGGTLRTGYATATKELVFYTDADLPADLAELARAIRLLELQQADVLAGYRFDRTGEGFRRALLARGYNALIRALFGLRIRDVNFAFKLFRRALLERVTLTSEGSFIDAEFLLRAREAGAAVIQMGLDYFPRSRGPSKLSSAAVIRGILSELIRFRRGLR